MLLGANAIGEGIVHIYDDVGESFGKICVQGWDIVDAGLVCQQLGYVSAQQGRPYIII